MLRSNNRLRKFLSGVSSVLAVAIAFFWLRTLATVDPFANLRKAPAIASQVGVRLEDVQLWHYKGAKLRTKAHVARVDVRQDRQYLDLYGVSDGLYLSDKGSFKFAAARADWSAATRRIEVESGGRVSGDHFDLTVAGFYVDQAKSVLRIPGRMVGRIYDGNVVAQNLTYQLATGNYSFGPATWEGMLAMPLQDDDATGSKTKWKIKSDGIVTHEGDVDTWPNGEATDGDVLVKADLVKRNSKTDVITATGNVRYFSSKANVTCEKAVIYRKDKRADFTGDVHMVWKPEDQQSQPLMVVEIPPFRPLVPDDVAKERPPAPPIQDQDQTSDEDLHTGKNAKKFPVTALADSAQYWYGKGQKHAIITGHCQARQDLPGGRWRHVWTNKGLYDGEKETLRLVSADGKKDTRSITSWGDDLVCTWFQISTKDGDDNWTAKDITGDVMTDESEVPSTKDNKQGGKPEPGKPPPDQKPKPAEAPPPGGGGL